MFFLHDVEKINNVSSFVRTFWFEFFWHSLPCFLYTMSIHFCERNFFPSLTCDNSAIEILEVGCILWQGWHFPTLAIVAHSQKIKRLNRVSQKNYSLPIFYSQRHVLREISKYFCKRCSQFCKNQLFYSISF